MDLKQIEYIVKIDDEHSITRAAEKLFRTRSRHRTPLDIPAKKHYTTNRKGAARNGQLPFPGSLINKSQRPLEFGSLGGRYFLP